MKIAFRVDYGNNIGLGHLMRMSALAEAFVKNGCDCKFFKNEDEPIDYSSFDIVIVDTYLVSDEYISALNAPRRLVVCYDDNSLYSYDCDVLINANLYASELKFRYGAKKPLLLLGGKYALLRKEFRRCKPIKIGAKANRIFICFGGSDSRNSTPLVVKSLQMIQGVELIVVLGEMTTCDDDVHQIATGNVRVLKNPQSMAAIMCNCDVAVTAAGSMSYELATLGLPSLQITQADNQEKVAEYMNRNNLMRCVGDWKKFDEVRLRSETEALLSDYQRRLKESWLLRQSVDKNGVHNIVDEVLSMVK